MGDKPRGRPRTLKEDVVMERVLLALWNRGFHAISMNDLARVVGVSKPSLYNTFGNKTELLKRALALYCQRNSSKAVKLESAGAIQRFARGYWQVTIDDFFTPELPGSCFLVASTMECGEDEPLSEFIHGLHRELRASLVQSIQVIAAEDGHVDPGLLADYIRGQAFALAVMVRAGAGRPQLEAFADAAKEGIQALCRRPEPAIPQSPMS